jgi:hypothetical protein
MKQTDPFKATIKAYLDKRAESDELFAVSYAKENKNLDECCNFILNEVQKSGCNGFADEEIFGMAVHYYDEDDIKNVKVVNCRVVVNHTVELTEEEIKQAKADAIQKAQDEAYAKLTSKKVAPKKDVPELQQASLF